MNERFETMRLRLPHTEFEMRPGRDSRGRRLWIVGPDLPPAPPPDDLGNPIGDGTPRGADSLAQAPKLEMGVRVDQAGKKNGRSAEPFVQVD